ncbi:hypothetical protein A6R68_07685 [Neotoma lepida]|uniref:Uncharacterized protein n=1 Tax=Neotoma lepida TaxID=56216 RepID=A0A1A6GC10_NEOLE|nr:hypothetical protein A6R68_07685 [Neotoma lepida]
MWSNVISRWSSNPKRKIKTPKVSVRSSSYYVEDGGMEPREMKESVSTPAWVIHRDQDGMMMKLPRSCKKNLWKLLDF